jgi:hypothetical protein
VSRPLQLLGGGCLRGQTSYQEGHCASQCGRGISRCQCGREGSSYQRKRTKSNNGKTQFRSRWYVPPLSRVKADEIALMKDLKKAKLDALRPQNQPTQEAHLAEVERLEREHSQSGKQLVEAEGSVTKKQSELSRWRVEKEEVGKLEVGDEGAWADGKVYVPLSLSCLG